MCEGRSLSFGSLEDIVNWKLIVGGVAENVKRRQWRDLTSKISCNRMEGSYDLSLWHQCEVNNRFAVTLSLIFVLRLSSICERFLSEELKLMNVILLFRSYCSVASDETKFFKVITDQCDIVNLVVVGNMLVTCMLLLCLNVDSTCVENSENLVVFVVSWKIWFLEKWKLMLRIISLEILLWSMRKGVWMWDFMLDLGRILLV
ncbi:OLC1v1012439C1 [Oldenlandia corymbosa var. corymbosa]|uniref:OLC1v1012439C1 n=1 Tax=Oldenlandia corymbosa var. corymbosa TaxID=529605 RepID=A0AAV1DZ58_OLDCO|nr:OLC1v1012439C1 [Oldenlandia corymbosa var. corymbosa]